MDTELFELCKEVYKRKPEWYGDMFGWSYTDLFSKSEYKRMRGRNGTSVPEYTSDYLLEKLPRDIPRDENSYFFAELYLTPTVADSWNAGYRVGASFPDYGCNADTPLKALLKLTIALDDAGELEKQVKS
jgi:hypothetical protein